MGSAAVLKEAMLRLLKSALAICGLGVPVSDAKLGQPDAQSLPDNRRCFADRLRFVSDRAEK
jgi:hypothetical protein